MSTNNVTFDISQIDHFPDEILENIFKFLSVQQQIRLRPVCRRWSKLALKQVKSLNILFGQTLDFEICEPDFIKLPFQQSLDQNCDGIIFLIQQAGTSLQKFSLKGFLFWYGSTNMYKKAMISPSLNALHEHCPNLVSVDFDTNYMDINCDLLDWVNWLKLHGNRLEKFTFDRYIEMEEVIDFLDPERITCLILKNETYQINEILERFPLLTKLEFAFEGQISVEDIESLKSLNHLRSLTLTSYFDEYNFWYSLLDYFAECPMAVTLNALDVTGIDFIAAHFECIHKLANLVDFQVCIKKRKMLLQVFALKGLEKLSLTIECNIPSNFKEFYAINQLQMLTSLTLNCIRDSAANMPFKKLKPMLGMQFFQFKQTCKSSIKKCLLACVIDTFPNLQVLHYLDHKLTCEKMKKQLHRLSQLRKVCLLAPEDLNFDMSDWNHLDLHVGFCCQH